MPNASAPRIHYMDALRSVLMLLGAVLHSARPYDTGAWQVKDAATLPVLDGLTSAIHLFRMPAFFVVAGFFSMNLLLRRPTRAFLVERLRRVLMPLLATLLTFNLLQVWVVWGSGGEAGFLAGSLLPAWRAGMWVSHLWFLAVLATYFAGMALAAPLVRRLADPGVVAWLERRHTLGLLIGACALAPLGVAVASRLLKPGLSELVLGTVSIGELLSFLPHFVVGMLLYVAPRLLERFASRGWDVIALAEFRLE